MSSKGSVLSTILSSCLKFDQGYDFLGGRFQWMIDLREGLFQPSLLKEIASLLWPRIRIYSPDRLGGVTMSADQLTIALLLTAMQEGYRVDGFSIRKTPKGYGLRKIIEGPDIKPGQRVVIVDDLISSGSTLTQAASTVTSAGGVVVAAAVVIDFQRGGKERLEEIGISTIAITNLADLGIAPFRNEVSARHIWQFGVLNVGTYTAPQCSPVLVRDKILVGADLGFVVALSMDGKELWRVSTEEHVFGVRGQIIASAGHIYFGGHDGYFYCVSDSGCIQWKVRVADWISVPAAYDLKCNSLFILVNFKDGHGECLSLNAMTGLPRWRFSLNSFVHAWPTFVEEDSLVIVASNLGGVVALDCETGHMRWHCHLNASVKGRIVAGNSGCYFGAFDGNFYALETKSGKEIWRRRLGDWLLCLPAIRGDRIVVGGSAHVCCLDARHGTVLWVRATQSRVTGVAISADGTYCVCGSDMGMVFGLDALNGKELWSYSVGHPVRAVPLIHDDLCIFPAYDGLLHCVTF